MDELVTTAQDAAKRVLNDNSLTTPRNPRHFESVEWNAGEAVDQRVLGTKTIFDVGSTVAL